MVSKIIESIFKGFIRIIVGFIKEIIINELLYICGSLYKYLEKFKIYRFTRTIIISRIFLWTIVGLFTSLITLLSENNNEVEKTVIVGSFVGFIAGVLEFSIDWYRYKITPIVIHKNQRKYKKSKKNRI